MGLQMILVLSITGLIAFNGANAQQTSVSQEWTAIEKYIPEINLFRLVGDWTLSASSNPDLYFTRLSVRLVDNQIRATTYLDNQVIGFGNLDHSEPDSKAVRTEATFNGKTAPTKIYILYFCPRIVIYLLDREGEQKTLRVLTTSEESVGQEVIRQIIITKLMSNPEIRSVIKDFVATLVFQNNDILPAVYQRQQMPLSDCDTVDFDLTRVKDLSSWHLKARAAIPSGFNFPYTVKWRLNGDQAIGSLFDSNNQEIGTSSERAVKTTKLYESNVYQGSNHFQLLTAIIYADAKHVVALGVPTSTNQDQEPILAVWALNDQNSDSEYMKRVIENQLLFSHDTRRAIKDLVPKLEWV